MCDNVKTVAKLAADMLTRVLYFFRPFCCLCCKQWRQTADRQTNTLKDQLTAPDIWCVCVCICVRVCFRLE